MQSFPHRYQVTATGDPSEKLSLESPGLQTLESAAPVEFGGPGGKWSPETLLVAAVADCFLLTFRAIALASRVPWIRLTCRVEGVLGRQDGVTRFTIFNIKAELIITQASDEKRALRLLDKAEKNCLITNSLAAHVNLLAVVTV